jgi:hypothetical protein
LGEAGVLSVPMSHRVPAAPALPGTMLSRDSDFPFAAPSAICSVMDATRFELRGISRNRGCSFLGCREDADEVTRFPRLDGELRPPSRMERGVGGVMGTEGAPSPPPLTPRRRRQGTPLGHFVAQRRPALVLRSHSFFPHPDSPRLGGRCQVSPLTRVTSLSGAASRNRCHRSQDDVTGLMAVTERSVLHVST